MKKCWNAVFEEKGKEEEGEEEGSWLYIGFKPFLSVQFAKGTTLSTIPLWGACKGKSISERPTRSPISKLVACRFAPLPLISSCFHLISRNGKCETTVGIEVCWQFQNFRASSNPYHHFLPCLCIEVRRCAYGRVIMYTGQKFGVISTFVFLARPLSLSLTYFHPLLNFSLNFYLCPVFFERFALGPTLAGYTPPSIQRAYSSSSTSWGRETK